MATPSAPAGDAALLAAAVRKGRRAKPRQAVIVIHGIGEQRPMETLRGFVDAVLDQKPSTSQVDAAYYSKPDFLSDNLELRRLVSAGGRGDRTDFYEFYWAHLMPTASWDRLASWYWVLMFRGPTDVPRRIFPIWALSWLATLATLGLGIVSILHFAFGVDPVPHATAKAPWLLAAILAGLSGLVRGYIGDVAVYLSPTPRNIESRQKIRAAGLGLLDRVTGSGRYNRVVVVGHSLGSMIGYDVLTFAWQRHVDARRRTISAAWREGQLPTINRAAIQAAEKLTKAIRDDLRTDPPTLAEHAAKWRAATRGIAAEMKANGDDWLVTDFVTLGSPLTHGDVLLARNREDFGRRTRERELPRCPPVRELVGRFSFKHEDRDSQGRLQNAWLLNQGALFAATAWTNLYFPSRGVLWGDFVGGPVVPLFWAGVTDIPVRTHHWGGWLSHTHYWTRDDRDRDPATAPVVKLREALALSRKKPARPARANPPAEQLTFPAVEDVTGVVVPHPMGE